ncbi:hypothetical protein MFIFM68171_07095 [Madurella fahalii]|uniref:Uncharacterized protein n=1 Tax=Madurella fahalii TaxID=1157608 RepID=A0ABQ0GGS1_9PEZI
MPPNGYHGPGSLSVKTTTWHPDNAATYGVFFGNFDLIEGCGTTPDKAIRAGCKYDILSNHWVPGQCLDEAAVAEYQRDGSWLGYADSNRTQVLTVDEMGSMPEGFYYTTMRDHIVHCASLWKKQFRAFAENRAVLDWVVADEEHTMHCAQFLVDMTETEGGLDYRHMPIKVFVGYAPCWVRER